MNLRNSRRELRSLRVLSLFQQNYQMYLSKVYPKWKEKLRQSSSSHEERNRVSTVVVKGGYPGAFADELLECVSPLCGVVA